MATPGRHGWEDYADPGYLDGKPRYPLTKDGQPSKGRVRDALGRLTQNADRYTPAQLRLVRSRIERAARRFTEPIHIDPSWPLEQPGSARTRREATRRPRSGPELTSHIHMVTEPPRRRLVREIEIEDFHPGKLLGRTNDRAARRAGRR